MKNLFITITIIFSFSYANGQDTPKPEKKKLDFGIRHGYSNLDIRTSSDSDNQLSLYLGLYAEKRISERLSLRIETNYSGRRILEIPLILKYNISNKISIYGGFQLDASIDDSRTSKAFQSKKFGASLVFGTEYRINNNWFLDLRYVHGLTNQYNIFQGFDNDPVFGKKRSLNLGIRYRF